MYDVIVVGCGLSGMVCARKLADLGNKVLIIEKRDHIGGNVFDEIDKDGFLIQKYGPHCFFTDSEIVKKYIENFIEIEDCFVKCRTIINGLSIPMPFNFTSIEMIYGDKADSLKKRLVKEFQNREYVSVTEILNSSDPIISEYGKFMFDNEYRLYSAKQWGRDISDISPDVFHRVPVYLSALDAYQTSKYQFMPVGGFTELSRRIIDSDNIRILLETNALEEILSIEGDEAIVNLEGTRYRSIPILYTGQLDFLFGNCYGKLPYRSLEFIWKLIKKDEFQETAITAYPQADIITRVTEYKKLPYQDIRDKTKISLEIPVEYNSEGPMGNEPYYPILNDENRIIYTKYSERASKVKNLFLCGRLAEYKYYNMDSVILRALDAADSIKMRYL